MKKLVILFAVVLLAMLALYRLYRLTSLENAKELSILLVYNPETIDSCRHVINAYTSVLEEEGVPFKAIPYDFLFSLNIDEVLIRKYPAIIFPDCLNQKLHKDIKNWLKKYITFGGSAFIVYDVGIRDYKGAYLKQTIFSEIVGINYITYDKLRTGSYTYGYFRVKDNSLLAIPPGKLDEKHSLIKGYVYDNLLYPIARVDVLDDNYYLIADALSIDGYIYPGIVIKKYGKGIALWVNLPLGSLKAYSDDLPLRLTLRAFLFKLLRLPHLVNVPKARGGLVINWHIDANADWSSIPMMIKEGYVSENLEQSFHITAGDFRDVPGDGLGFDACGKGEIYVRMLLPYGVIGSHGGWAHNWFSDGIIEGKIGHEQIREYIQKNNACLERITVYKLREYSAPNGVHPQPYTTKILEDLGFNSYYYVGDSGSSPNRTFFNGFKVSDKVVAFPVITYEKNASLYEIQKAGVPENKVKEFLFGILDYVNRERVVRLFYSHPYDIPRYPLAVKEFIKKAEELSKKGEIEVKPMSYFAEFLLRFIKTKYIFKVDNENMVVVLKNQEGLKDITVAVPKEYIPISSEEYEVFEDETFRYIVIKRNLKETNIYLSLIK